MLPTDETELVAYERRHPLLRCSRGAGRTRKLVACSDPSPPKRGVRARLARRSLGVLDAERSASVGLIIRTVYWSLLFSSAVGCSKNDKRERLRAAERRAAMPVDDAARSPRTDDGGAPPENGGRRPFERPEECYLVDPASSHMLVSKIKPCMCKYEQIQTVKLRMAH